MDTVAIAGILVGSVVECDLGGALGLPHKSCASPTVKAALRPRMPPNYIPCHNGQPRSQHLDKEICHVLVRMQAKQKYIGLGRTLKFRDDGAIKGH